MASVTGSFTALGSTANLLVKHMDKLTYTVSGTFVGTWVLEKVVGAGAAYEQIATGTGEVTAIEHQVKSSGGNHSLYRMRCSAYTSGTMDVSVDDATGVVLPNFQMKNSNGDVVLELNDSGVSFPLAASVSGVLTPSGGIARTSQKTLLSSHAKVGTTAGFVVDANNDLGLLATLPASQSASTLVIPISGLKVGDTITSFHLVGQIESAGGTVTVDADLRKLTAAAADVTDASIGAITQLSVIADTVMSSANTAKTLATAEVVAEGETFYILVTATTAGSTDIALQGVAVVVTEA